MILKGTMAVILSHFTQANFVQMTENDRVR